MQILSKRQRYRFDRSQMRRPMAAGYWRNALNREVLPELLGNGGAFLLFDEWNRAFQSEVGRIAQSLRINLTGMGITEIATTVGYAIAGVILVRQTVPHNVPGLVAGLQAASLIISVAVSQSRSLGRLTDGILRLREADSWIWDKRVPDEGHVLGEHAEVRFTELEVRAVSYRYPSGRPTALNAGSSVFKLGQVVALIGHNGAGKTTFARCLLGQLHPSAGAVLVDGRPLVYDGSWAATCAYVPQQPSMMDVTIRKYVTLGTQYGDSDLLNALTRVGAEWAMDRLDQRLGYIAHNGTQVSLGQRQQLAMARIILRRNARLVVLDEPYSGLDPVLLRRTLDLYRELAQDRLVIVITHRVDVAATSDHIVWFDNGRIIQQGSPEALWNCAEFIEFWHDQASAGVSTLN